MERKVYERADLSGIPDLGEQEMFQLYDRVLLSPPAGNVGAEQLVTLEL